MESIYTEFALNGSKHLCARTYNVFIPISEVCDGTVSLSMPNIKTVFHWLLVTGLTCLTSLIVDCPDW